MSEMAETFLGKPNAEAMRALFSSLCVIAIILIIAVIVNIKARKVDPLKKPKGIVHLFEIFTNLFDGMVEELMGKRFKGFGGFIFAIAAYILLSFLWGLTGLTGPLTNLAAPLSLGLLTFSLIHITSARYTKWGYFKRYVEPFPVFLPVNLLSMWAPLLSMTFRLFGNAFAGWILTSVLYSLLETLSSAIFSALGNWGSIILPPFIMPVLHCYFDLFSGVIQTVVFIMLTMLFVGNEAPDEIEMESELVV